MTHSIIRTITMTDEHIMKIHAALCAANIEYAAYSSDGVNVVGDVKSIAAAKAAFHSHGQIDALKTNLRHWRDECGKLQAKIAALTLTVSDP